MVPEGGSKGLKNLHDRLHFNLVESAGKKVRSHEDAGEELHGVGATEKPTRLEWLR